MRIIGRTATAYLVEMERLEIAIAAGYSADHDTGFLRAMGVHGYRDPLMIGTEIKTKLANDFHSRIEAHQEAARKGAGTLRALADLMDRSMPDVLIPPSDPKPAPAEQNAPTTND